MHPKEFKKVRIATGRLTHLQMKNSEIMVDVDFTHNKRLNELIATHNSFVLYPNEKSLNLSDIKEEKPKQLRGSNLIIVIDATWYLAKKMYKESSNLHQLNSLSFEPKKRSGFLVKQQPHPQCLSTIESVQIVLKELNRLNIENSPLDSFLNPFQELVSQQIACQQYPPEGSYRSEGGTQLTIKDQYRSTKSRNLIFLP
tara:strand:+ start:4839 stop:5435 length:597 start_codon:yes stop_codon:yes gene_type:complete